MRFFTLILFLFFSSLNAQENPPDALQLVKTIEKETVLMEVDKLGYMYLVDQNNGLVKYNEAGDSLYRFQDNTFGEISHLDISNPFQVLVYYEDYQNLFTLDRNLVKTGAVDLSTIGFSQVNALAFSNQSQLWIYDADAFKIKKYNQSKELVLESESLALSFQDELQINRIMERNNWLYLNAPNKGILVFDIFGNYKKTLYYEGLDYFQIFNNRLILFKENQLKAFHLVTYEEQLLKLPEVSGKIHQICVGNHRLYIRFADRIELYSF